MLQHCSNLRPSRRTPWSATATAKAAAMTTPMQTSTPTSTPAHKIITDATAASPPSPTNYTSISMPVGQTWTNMPFWSDQSPCPESVPTRRKQAHLSQPRASLAKMPCPVPFTTLHASPTGTLSKTSASEILKPPSLLGKIDGLPFIMPATDGVHDPMSWKLYSELILMHCFLKKTRDGIRYIMPVASRHPRKSYDCLSTCTLPWASKPCRKRTRKDALPSTTPYDTMHHLEL
mmetsp:Transcript_94712/g.272685  ORF Transcript_94712/g.272685 Transcript_94712/m.272685 type:complete len:233 (+) Transcript_94712:360-1058(+)